MGLRLEKSPYSLDDPRTTLHHRDVILSKPFLKKLYVEWYNQFKTSIEEIQTKIPNGKIEIIIEKLEILNTSKTPPFGLDEFDESGEDIRLKYRYFKH